jgi:hypothetical protein
VAVVEQALEEPMNDGTTQFCPRCVEKDAEISHLWTALIRAENHIPTADLDAYLEAKRRAAAPTEETDRG